MSESGNTRVVQVKVGYLSQPVTLNMHVVVREEVAGMPYDNHHKARSFFDASGLGSGSSQSSDDAVENPPIGDSTSIGLYLALLFGSIVVFSVYRLRVAKN